MKPSLYLIRKNFYYKFNHIYTEEMKPCPKCGALIVKMNDGSCNHMTCSVCDAEFCWLCLQEITDLHYLRFVIFKKFKLF